MGMVDTLTSQQNTKWSNALSLYEQGASDVEVAKELGITKKAFEKMYSEVVAFAAFVDKGRTVSEAWWHTQLRHNIGNKDWNTTLFNFAMKNRFNWADKVDTTSTSTTEGGDMDQMRRELAVLIKKLEEKEPELTRNLFAIDGGRAK